MGIVSVPPLVPGAKSIHEKSSLNDSEFPIIFPSKIESELSLRGRLHGAFFMCVSMSDKPFDAEACDIGGQASPTNGLTDATNGLSDVKNAPCNRPLRTRVRVSNSDRRIGKR
jgi:hypothetical protein